jgi:hypothetical protein
VRTRFSLWRLLLGGLIMGLAVNLMHYTGMWALEIQGTINYNTTLVWLSIVIAIVAATAALWFTVLFDSIVLRLVAGAIMGVAVTGMHYTGMAAMEVHVDPSAPAPGGVEVFTFLFPVFVLAVLALAVPIYSVLMASTWNESTAEPEKPEMTPAPQIPLGRPPRRHTTHSMGQGVRGVSDLASRYTADDRRENTPREQQPPVAQELPKRAERPVRR